MGEQGHSESESHYALLNFQPRMAVASLENFKFTDNWVVWDTEEHWIRSLNSTKLWSTNWAGQLENAVHILV